MTCLNFDSFVSINPLGYIIPMGHRMPGPVTYPIGVELKKNTGMLDI